jgi:hypothetical protein
MWSLSRSHTLSTSFRSSERESVDNIEITFTFTFKIIQRNNNDLYQPYQSEDYITHSSGQLVLHGISTKRQLVVYQQNRRVRNTDRVGFDCLHVNYITSTMFIKNINQLAQ